MNLGGQDTVIDFDVSRNFSNAEYEHIYSVINYNETFESNYTKPTKALNNTINFGALSVWEQLNH